MNVPDSSEYIFLDNEESVYERISSNFSQGGGTATTISGLILASALIAGLMIGCKEENSSKPTAPNIPIYPEGQTSENSNEMGFYSAKGDGQFGAFVNKNSEFQISVPTGEFLLTYTTTAGTYYVAFRATDSAILFIGLNKDVQVLEASVQKGKITNESQKKWQSNSVTLFAWPDGPAWNGVFQSDGSAAIALIKNQNVAPDVNKLPEPQSAPNPQPTANPTQQPGSSTNTFTNSKNATFITTTISTGNAKTTTVKNSQGNSLVVAVYTLSGVSLSFPGKTSDTNNLIYPSPQISLPSDEKANMFATYVANQISDDSLALAAFSQLGNWVNNPGCDLFPETLFAMCPIRCCALHDYEYDKYRCKATSWLFPLGTSLECNLANLKAALCIVYNIGCSDIGQKCYSTTCHTYYECAEDTCNTKICPEPCLVTPTPTPISGQLSLKLICNGSETSCGNINMGESATLEMHWVNPKKDGGKITFIAPCAPLPDNPDDLELNISIPSGVLSGIAYAQVGHRYRDCFSYLESSIWPSLSDGSGYGVYSSNLMSYMLIGDNPSALLPCDGCIKAR